MSAKLTVGFLDAGKIVAALAKGLVRLKLANADQILASPIERQVHGEAWMWSLLFFATLPVLGQPANDNFANRVVLTGTEISVTASNIGATREDGESNDDGPGTLVRYVKSVWWSWTAPTNGLVVLQTRGSDFITVLEVYTGAALSNLTLIANADVLHFSIDNTHATFRATSGVTYQIVVGGLDPKHLPNYEQGTIQLRLSLVETPANDHFGGRINLGSGDIRKTGSNMAATMEPGEVYYYSPPSERSVWWTWTATNSGPVTVTLNGNRRDPDDLPSWLGPPISILAVYVGDGLRDLQLIARDVAVNAYPQFSQVTFQGVAGQTYQILVDGLFGLRQSFDLNVAETKPPLIFIVRPEFDAAYRASSTVPLRAETFDPDGTIQQVEFYLFPDYTDQPITTLVSERPFATALSNAPAGKYWLRAAATDNRGARAGAISVAFDVRPINDNFADRISFSGSHTSVTGTLANATVETPTNAFPAGDIWWSWTASEAGLHTFSVIQPNGYRPSVAIYSDDSLANLQMLAQSVFDLSDPDFFAQVAFPAVVGTTYQIAVSTYTTIHGPVTLSVTHSAAPTVSITSPTNGTAVVIGRPISISTAASDPDGVVAKVEVLDEFSQQVLGVVANPPFNLTLTLTNNASVRASATDDAGNTAYSKSVYVYQIAAPGIPPPNDDFLERIPLAGALVTTNGSLANATLEPSEPLQGQGSIWWEWTAPSSGVYTVRSRATNMNHFLGIYQGADIAALTLVGAADADYVQSSFAAQVVLHASSGVAYPIAISMYGGAPDEVVLNIVPTTPPVVSITSPTNNARFIVGDVVTLVAEAADSDGVIERIDFFDGGVLIGSDTNAPYSVNVPLTSGHSISEVFAQATDNFGVTTRSEPVGFRVDYPPPTNDAFANRVPLSGTFVVTTGSAAWATLEPDEPNPNGGQHSLWWSWAAPQSGPVTIAASAKALAVFTGSSLPTLTLVTNGVFVPQGFGDSTIVTFSAQAGETYQIAVDASDTVTLRIAPTTPPVVTIVSPTNDAVFIEGELVAFAADVTDDGSILTVNFFVDSRFVGSTTNPPFNLTLTNGFGAGSSYLRATATDEFGIGSSSPEVRVSVNPRPPENDAFSSRMPLDGFLASMEISTRGATREPGEANPSGSAVGGTAWWSWIPPMTGTAIITVGDVPSMLFVRVYVGTNLTNLALVAENPVITSNDGTRRLEFGAVGRVPYEIAIDSTDGLPNYPFTLTVFLDARALGPVEHAADGMVRGQFLTTFDEPWIVEASPDLLNWTAISTNDPINGVFEFQDGTAIGAARRFYRARSTQ